MTTPNNHLNSSKNPLNFLLKISPRKSIIEEKKIPKNIGVYELKEKIIDGGYCKIYLGKSKYTGDKVAIKVIEKIFFIRFESSQYDNLSNITEKSITFIFIKQCQAR